MDVRAARVADQWHDVADLLFAYQRETAVELDKDPPARPEQVWGPVRHEVIDPASVFTTYLIAYEGSHPLGGVGLVAPWPPSLQRRPQGQRRRCVAGPFREGHGVPRTVSVSLPSDRSAELCRRLQALDGTVSVRVHRVRRCSQRVTWSKPRSSTDISPLS